MDIVKDPEVLSSFCRVMVQTSIQKAIYIGDGEQKRHDDRLDYRWIDSFIKLIVVLLKTFDFSKFEFMTKVFESIYDQLDEDHTIKQKEFNQKPYYRLLMNILTAVNRSDCFNPKTHLLILFSLAELFNKLNPNKYPGFAFAWLGLISHKNFMPHFLKTSPSLQEYSLINRQNFQAGLTPQQRAMMQQNTDNMFYQKWFKMKELIVNLFIFLKNNMSQEDGQNVSQSVVEFYSATLRVCLVILHDFPEFLCDFHFNFVNALPDHCVQLRNLILSAFPKNIQPPNPFGRNLKVDLLTDVKSQPKILSNYDNYLSLMNIREDLEEYFKTKKPKLVQTICEKMMQSEEIINGVLKINLNVINAVVLFIGNHSQSKHNSDSCYKESMELFKQIMLNLNSETRKCFINSIINELRYPNNQTYYFSCIILYLFVESNSEVIQEQIAKVLFERLQVHRPHPWGLMISFRELIQNPKYGFMRKSFIVKNQETVDKLFETKLKPFNPFINNRQPTGETEM